jgi:predicted ATPase/DNA-binding winged helix-turn-helix (wHTH) protein
VPRETQFSLGPYQLNVETGELVHAGRILKLTPKTTGVLLALAQRKGELVTKQDLFRTVWRGRAVSDAALTTCIQELRQALQDEAKQPRYVETLHRRGYRLLVPLVPLSVPHEGAPAPSSRGMVGRVAELAELERRLTRALIGRCQIMFVVGEPGIGKTTLLDMFADRHAANGELAYTVGRCAEHYGPSEAYLPLLDAITRLCRGPHAERVLRILRRHAPGWLAQLPSLLDDAEVESLQRRTVGATRERMLRELADALTAISADIPLILRLEDLHWSDASTLDWLGFFARRIEPARLLIVSSARPIEGLSHTHPLSALYAELAVAERCGVLRLAQLGPAEVAEYLALRFGHAVVDRRESSALAEAIHGRTEGNPLFVVNVANDLVARGMLVERDGGWVLAGRIKDVAATIPDDLRRLIELQLERLSAGERELLEVASAAGEEFSAAAVAAALGEPTETTEIGCSELVRRALFLENAGSESWPDGTVASRYAFRHALYRATLYERLPAARRARLHVAIAARLEAGFGEHARERAAELATHFEHGRDLPRAVRYHHLAGDAAGARSAAREAIEHYRRALKLLADLPDSGERTRHEITLNIALGPHLLACKGFGAPEAAQVYQRAQSLCDHIGATGELFAALWGLWLYVCGHGHLDEARQIGERLLGLATDTHDRSLLLQAHHALWATSLERGELLECFEHANAGAEIYIASEHTRMAARFGNHDAGACCRWFHALALALHGDLVHARVTSQAAIRLTEDIGHAFSQALAQFFAAALEQIIREPAAAQWHATGSGHLASEHGFEMVGAWSGCISGWALAVGGEHARGIAMIGDALSAARATGTRQLQPYLCGVLADACLAAGRVSEGLEAVRRGLEAARSTNERFYEAELQRLEGELASAQGATDAASLGAFERAIETARRQAARLLELRALVSLLRGREAQADCGERHQRLLQLTELLGPGCDGADAVEARRLAQSWINPKAIS